MAPTNRLITGKVNLNSDFFSSKVFKRDQGEEGDQTTQEVIRSSYVFPANDGEESKIESNKA